MTSPIEPFLLERYFARWEFRAPYLLCSSDIQGWQMRDLVALADPQTLSLWEDLSLGYTETAGHPDLRAEIAQLYRSVLPESIFCFAGAEEAIYICMRVILRPGDHVIVTFPGYQSLYTIAESIGAEVSYLPIRLRRTENRIEWKADPDELRSLVRPNTRMILLNFPHNPTGALPTPLEWAHMVETARQAGCYLFSDEVYRFLEYDEADRLPAAVDCYDRAISLGVMSKPFGLAGLRIGWLASHDPQLVHAFAAYKDYTTICNSAPSEILALIALRARHIVLDRSRAILRNNLSLVENFMQEYRHCLQWIAPRAGSIAFPGWMGDSPIDRFCEELVQSEGVLLLPATVYNYPGKHFRLGLGRENLPQALEHFAHFLKRQGV